MNANPPIQRTLLKSKIHRATLTGKELNYEGSIAIDRDLIEAADLVCGEQVQVLNGPAARLGETGDLVVIVSYALVPEPAVREYRAKSVHVDAHNRLR